MSLPSSNPAHLQRGDRRQELSPSSLVTGTQHPIHRVSLEAISRIIQYATTPVVDHLADQTRICRDDVPPTQSGCNLRLVCSAWDRASIGTPSLWTNLAAFIDKPHTAESLATSLLPHVLRRSQPLPVSFHLRRRVKVPHTLDLVEQASVTALLDALEDHFERVEVLIIETNLASSLPNALSLLSGVSSALRPSPSRLVGLILRCNTDDSILQPPFHYTLSRPVKGQFLLQRWLKTLHLDGRNLLEMLRSSIYPNGLRLENIFGCMPILEDLAVNNLTFCVDGFSKELVHGLFDVIPLYPHLKTLALENFDLGPGFPQHPLTSPSIPAYLPRLCLTFKHATRDSIEYVLGCITRPHTVVMFGCYVLSPSSFPPTILPTLRCSTLVITHLQTDFNRGLPALIAGWNGEHLELIKCACVNDQFWAALSKSSLALGFTPLSSKVGSRMRSLRVVDCPNFLADSLINFLKVLNGNGLEDLVVAGDQSPKLETTFHLRWAKELVSKRVEWRPLDVHY